VQFGGLAISTAPLDWRLWLISIGLGSLMIPWGFVVRLVPPPEWAWLKYTREHQKKLKEGQQGKKVEEIPQNGVIELP
jgi:hypothetical protein